MSAPTWIGVQSGKPPLELQLKRYQRSYRRRLRKLATGSKQLNDLIHAFPAAAIVLATGQGSPQLRRHAIALVAEGARLREVAEALQLPWWMRRLPPEAFSETLSLTGRLPASERFTHRISNHIPPEAVAARMWLAWVLHAHALGGETFALWIAAQDIYHDNEVVAEALLPLAAYAWYSVNAGETARGLIERLWTAETSFARAVMETRNLLLRIVLNRCRDDRGASGRWFVPQRVSGLRFMPLRTLSDLVYEGERMNNCVASYAGMVASGECLIYSIRRGNEHVATLEVRSFMGQTDTPIVAQLEGPGNRPAAEAVARAVSTWISRQGRYPVVAPGQLAGVPIDAARWNAMWQPYWSACPTAARYAKQPVGAQLMRLTHNLAGLAGMAKIDR